MEGFHQPQRQQVPPDCSSSREQRHSSTDFTWAAPSTHFTLTFTVSNPPPSPPTPSELELLDVSSAQSLQQPFRPPSNVDFHYYKDPHDSHTTFLHSLVTYRTGAFIATVPNHRRPQHTARFSHSPRGFLSRSCDKLILFYAEWPTPQTTAARLPVATSTLPTMPPALPLDNDPVKTNKTHSWMARSPSPMLQAPLAPSPMHTTGKTHSQLTSTKVAIMNKDKDPPPWAVS